MIPMTVSLSDFHLSVRPDQSSFASVPPAPVSPIDSIGKFIGEKLVASQCRPGPRLMSGMQLYPVRSLVFIKGIKPLVQRRL